MLKTLTIILLCLSAAGTAFQDQSPTETQIAKIETVYDEHKNLTTVRLPSTQVSGAKAHYHNLRFSLHYSYQGKVHRLPEQVDFDLVSVVKTRRLNSDLYVAFLVDGKPIHFSSNRSAIRDPVPGRLWIGERMVFHIPNKEFVKLASAETLAIRMGSVTFEISAEVRDSLRAFSKAINGTGQFE